MRCQTTNCYAEKIQKTSDRCCFVSLSDNISRPNQHLWNHDSVQLRKDGLEAYGNLFTWIHSMSSDFGQLSWTPIKLSSERASQTAAEEKSMRQMGDTHHQINYLVDIISLLLGLLTHLTYRYFTWFYATPVFRVMVHASYALVQWAIRSFMLDLSTTLMHQSRSKSQSIGDN